MKTNLIKENELKDNHQSTDLIQLESYPIRVTLKTLLQDKTTKKNILWATDSYTSLGKEYGRDHEMTQGAFVGINHILLQPRSLKDISQQHARTKSHAEVFTPAWICNKMCNYCDTEWFERENVFNKENGQTWAVNEEKITFPKKKTWKHYIDSRRLEITCGEAPYLVSRYDSATGVSIEVGQRIGMLDRKLRIVNENTDNESDWMKWCIRAFESVYGYEFQGDNLLIGRINLLLTFVDYLEDRWHREPTERELLTIANRIAWNLWQMNGLTGLPPYSISDEYQQLSLFGAEDEHITPECRIFDWRKKCSLAYNDIKREREKAQ